MNNHSDLRWENPALYNITYDPESGEFRWIKIPRGARRDGVCGTTHIDRRGYRSRIIHTGGFSYKAHRLAWFKTYGLPVPPEIDHKDGDGTNNAISNLRASSPQLNKRNRHRQKNNKTGVTGVTQRGKRWTSQIQVDGKVIQLGTFSEFKDAVNARLNAERKYGFSTLHGKRARYDHEI